MSEKTTKQQQKEGYLHYFDWEMYLIICICYLFGFFGGWFKLWFLPFSLLFLIYPFYLRSKITRLNKKHRGNKKC